MTSTQPLAGKTALVMGVASEESIAWAIAKELAAQGARIVLGYQFRYHSRVMQLAPTLDNLVSYTRCDILDDAECEAFFGALSGPIDIVVHAIAFAPQTAYMGRVVETTDEDFTTALLTSSHSLARLMNYVRPHMPDGGSTIALTYLGGVRVSAGYKIMGVAKAALDALVRELAVDLGREKIRVNAISAGPIKTLAAVGVSSHNMQIMLDHVAAASPLRQNVSQQDVASCAAFLASDASRMITGQTLYVDGGYSIIGVPDTTG